MKLLVIDDHPIFRQGLTAALQTVFVDVIVDEADSVMAAMQDIENKADPELILLDINLGQENGLAQLHVIQQYIPGVPIVIISATQEPWQIQWAVERGAKGFIPKSSSVALVSNALQLVLGGREYWPQLLAKDIESTSLPPPNLLTSRQVEVLALMAKGFPNKNIAVSLGICSTTVRAHVTDILKALHAMNRTEAVYNAIRKGWLTQGKLTNKPD